MGNLLGAISFDNTITIIIFKFLSLVIALIGLLICLFGRKIIKPVISILCMVNGLFIGALLCTILDFSSDFLVTIIVLGGMVLGLILSIKYRKFMTNLSLSWFISLIFFVFAFGAVNGKIASKIILGFLIGVVAFIVFLILFKKYYDKMVIISMALFGSVLFSYFIFILFKYEGLIDYFGSLAMFGATNLYNNTLGNFYAIEGANESKAWIFIAVVIFAASCYFQIKKSKTEDVDDVDADKAYAKVSSSNVDKSKKLKIGETLKSINDTIFKKTDNTNNTAENNGITNKNADVSLGQYSTPIIASAILLSLVSLFLKVNVMLKITSIVFSIASAIIILESKDIEISKSLKDACLMLAALCCAIGIAQVLFTSGIIYYILEYALAAVCVYGLYKKQNNSSDGEFLLSVGGIISAINLIFLLILYSRLSFIMLAVLCICFVDSYALITKKQTKGRHVQGKHQAYSNPLLK